MLNVYILPVSVKHTVYCYVEYTDWELQWLKEDEMFMLFSSLYSHPNSFL